MAQDRTSIDLKSGFCKANNIFYSKRTPLSLPSDEYLNVATFISSRPHCGHIALIDASTDRSITFPELWEAVSTLSASLFHLGVRKGHVILLLCPNSIHVPIIFFAVTSLGAILTTVNPLNTPSEIAKQTANSKPMLAFTTPQLIPKLSGSSVKIAIIGQESEISLKSGGLNVVSTVEEMMTGNSSREDSKEQIRQDDVATLLYSSGTTGSSKGVVSTHRNIIASVQTIMNRFRSEDGPQRFICILPMFHIYGLAAFAGLIAMGSTVVVLPRFEMEEMLSAVERYSVTYLPLVPPILFAMINHAGAIRAKHNLRSLRWVLSGGAPLSKELIEGFLSEYPNVIILQGFGLTETTAIGASTDSLQESRRYGTAGLLSPNMQAKIVHTETGQAMGVNHAGELWLRGPTIMKEYFANPEATASTLNSEGWLRTGDLCYIDEDGFLFVVDRLKELIKYKGYQVAPVELEALLLAHPAIEDAAVIPYPDSEAGQVPFAYIVRKVASRLCEADVIKYVSNKVAPFKRVRRVSFVTSIPKTPSGKILRKDLINLAMSNL